MLTAYRRRPARPARLLAGIGLALALAVAAAPPTASAAAGLAAAREGGVECPVGQNDCNVWDDDPGTPGGGDPGGGDGGDGGDGDGSSGKCQWNGKVLPCYDEDLGWFDNGSGCYYKLQEPQPAGTPEGKQWYLVTCNGGDLGTLRPELLDAPPSGYGAPPDPEELARRALASISLRPPQIRTAPRASKGPGLVGLPVWMWASRGANYFGPLTASASDRGLTVSLRATVDRIVWDMGNGEKVTCDGPGTPYRAGGTHAGKPSPDCGYDGGYPRTGTYRVSATTFWNVHWEGGDSSGDIAQTRTSGTAAIEIDELQVVTR
ncbi:hypothetical protein [Micromonospora okii]|uniref:hypothetical protein n=1 Tax=Micromonospora okii TaxID=1182970 RepID=UPI001E295E1A|nr:hypothetical protein [Micromonospora okii]